MKRKVYVETTIASYLTARPANDILVAAHRTLTIAWWETHRPRFDLYVSEVVLREAGRGDRDAAARRLRELNNLPVLALNEQALDLARLFVEREIVPRKAVEDALHIAVATVHGMDFLLTWNCRHIANAELNGAA